MQPPDDTLDNAPPHIKLAVDLIMLLEQHQIPPQQALDALAIVTADHRSKLAALSAKNEMAK